MKLIVRLLFVFALALLAPEHASALTRQNIETRFAEKPVFPLLTESAQPFQLTGIYVDQTGPNNGIICRNDPVNYIDKLGLAPQHVLGVVSSPESGFSNLTSAPDVDAGYVVHNVEGWQFHDLHGQWLAARAQEVGTMSAKGSAAILSMAAGGVVVNGAKALAVRASSWLIAHRRATLALYIAGEAADTTSTVMFPGEAATGFGVTGPPIPFDATATVARRKFADFVSDTFEIGAKWSRKYFKFDGRMYVVSPDDGILQRPGPWRDIVEAQKPVLLGTEEVYVLGRRFDTDIAKDWPAHKVLDIENWSLRKNDAFVQSIVDKRAKVYLGSPQTRPNIWDPVNNRQTVFGREVDQLRAAGYQEIGDYLIPPIGD